MKKMVLLCAAVLACSGLAGCGQHKDNSSAKISSLKAENSSLKAKKSSSHKVKHQRKSSSSSQSKNDNNASSSQSKNDNNASSTAQTAKAISLNGTQARTQVGGNGQQQARGQSASNSRSGDWDNHPEEWAEVNDNSRWKGTIYENMTPQDRYNYQTDNANHWASVEGIQH